MSRLSWMEAVIARMSEHEWYSGKFSPDLRQAALEQDFGQIRCSPDPAAHNTTWCPGCGAQV